MDVEPTRIGHSANSNGDTVSPQNNFFVSLVLAGLLVGITYCIAGVRLIQLDVLGQPQPELVVSGIGEQHRPIELLNDHHAATGWPASGGNESAHVFLIDPALRVEAGSGTHFRDVTVEGKICEPCPEMVVVPAGTYFMGGSSSEPGRENWQKEIESPRVKVAIERPIAVGRGAISFRQWDMCVADGGCGRAPPDNGWGRGDLPVVNVTWKEAVGYTAWLSRKTGKPYRLLSEAEREYVARAGTATPFWFGKTASPKFANYLWDRTMPINDLKANPWGIFHVHGNANEWTADCWNASHQGHPGGAAPRLSGNCDRRVVKGGSWFNVEGLIRAASRSGLNADASYQTVGFRIARSIELPIQR